MQLEIRKETPPSQISDLIHGKYQLKETVSWHYLEEYVLALTVRLRKEMEQYTNFPSHTVGLCTCRHSIFLASVNSPQLYVFPWLKIR